MGAAAGRDDDGGASGDILAEGLLGGFGGFSLGFGLGLFGGFFVVAVFALFVLKLGSGIDGTGRSGLGTLGAVGERAFFDLDGLEEEGRLAAESIAIVVRGGGAVAVGDGGFGEMAILNAVAGGAIIAHHAEANFGVLFALDFGGRHSGVVFGINVH